ncbi:MAG: HD domain-containing protein [Deltaproteobacteria bacterium]|nr:HD domain-containing protein [Deltaproteobacteria bacterium]
MTLISSESILFIDDEQPVRVAFARIVKFHGFNIDLAADHNEARELVSKNSYAVIATDYRMPEVDGLTLIEELKQHQPNASYMLVSGECDLTLAMQAVNEHGVSYIVTKPWDADELKVLLNKAITTHQEKVLQSRVQQSVVGQSRSFEEQKRRLQEALLRSETFLAEILLNALDLRHHETRAHCRRVATYSRMLAEQMGVAGSALQSIYQGSLLHDIGKIGVPDSILLKPGPLDAEEWAIMRQHSSNGAKLLEGFESLAGAREIVLQHHERWDGTGYPGGLAGKSICIGARIFAVADALDAMLSERPYREPMSFAAAKKQLTLNSNSQFDADAVAAFLAICEQQWLEVRKQFVDELYNSKSSSSEAA